MYCKGDKRASDTVSACSDQLLDNGGKDITLLLDGLDELPEEQQKNSLIVDILKCELLPQCVWLCHLVHMLQNVSTTKLLLLWRF